MQNNNASSSMQQGGNTDNNRIGSSLIRVGEPTSDIPIEVGGSSNDGNIKQPISGERTWRTGNVQQDKVVAFVDSTNDVQEDKMPQQISLPFEGVVLDGIKEFLKRPIQVYEFSWNISNSTFNFDPWGLFYNNKTIQRKMGNFYKFSTGGLTIRVVTNGTPYLYGRYMIGYWPYYVSDPFATTFAVSSPTRISSLPCYKEIDPSANTVAIFHIPEVKQFEQLITQVALPWGSVVGCASPAGLASATATGNVQYCDMTFYVNCIDPKVEFNTYSNPYYGTSGEFKGKISTTLNNVSKYSSMLSKIPVIGQYANPVTEATRLGANVASMFGFSKPPIDNNIQRVERRGIGNITNIDGLDTTTVLALNRGALTTIDPTVLGLPPGDEMSLASIIERYALAYSFNWADTDAIGTVSANHYNGPYAGLAGSYPTAQTNLGFVANGFLYWRGTIVYRIVFPVSKFHTGRMQIIYDPDGNSTFATDPTNVTMSWIVDIAQQQEIEIEIPYCGKYKAQTLFNDVQKMGASESAANSVGKLSFHVINKLRAGSVATTITPLVFMKAGKDFSFYQPCMLNTRDASNLITYQASGTPGTAPTNAGYAYYGTSGTTLAADMPIVDEVIASERILSLRELGKRYTVSRIFTPAAPTTAGIYYFCVRDFPHQPGYSVNGTGSGATQLLYYNVPHNFFTYWGPAFVGWRGGIRTKLLPLTGNTGDMIINRAQNNLSDYMFGNTTTWDVPGTAKILGNFMNGADIISTQVPAYFGSQATCSGTSNAIEVTNPWVDTNLFELVGDYCNDYGKGSGIVVMGVTVFNSEATMPTFISMKATADDFSFIYYKGPPILYQTTIS